MDQTSSEAAGCKHNPACNCYGGNCGGKRDAPDFAAQALATLKQRGQSLEDLRALINGIDLTWVKRKIMDAREGKGWSQEKADDMEVRYKRFLYLFATSEGARIVSTLDIDAMWHQHILDTRAYFADCERVFGAYLHHFPYFGMRDEEDARELEVAFTQTRQHYEREYGETYVTVG